VSTWAIVTRTRAWSGLSAARFARMAATGRGGKSEAVAEDQPQLATKRHRLAKIGHERIPGGAALTHPAILDRKCRSPRGTNFPPGLPGRVGWGRVWALRLCPGAGQHGGGGEIRRHSPARGRHRHLAARVHGHLSDLRGVPSSDRVSPEGLHLERVRDTLADALPGLFKLGQAAGASDDRGNAGPPLLASRCDRRLSGIFPRGTVHELAGRAISSRRTPWKSSRR
jgi:hypothetical protein